jgi:hypothetical protein
LRDFLAVLAEVDALIEGVQDGEVVLRLLALVEEEKGLAGGERGGLT